MIESIRCSIDEAIKAIQQLQTQDAQAFIMQVSLMISDCYRQGNKILIAGNGGSLCDAMHFAEEMTGYFRSKRRALAAISLSDPGHLTCVANDTSFLDVFSRSVEALGKKGDILIVLSTSGNSPNLIKAIEVAKEMKLKTIAFLGKGGGKLKDLPDLQWIVDGFSYSDRVQEAHMAAIHIIIESVEKELFFKQKQPALVAPWD